MTIKVAINGFGRIGRVVFRRLLHTPGFEIVGLNDLTPVETSYHLLKYDSVHGRFQKNVTLEEGKIKFEGKEIPISSTIDVDEVSKNFNAWGADIVMECTGKVKGTELLKKFLGSSVKKVLLSRPIDKKSEADVPMFVMGVNHQSYDKDKHHIISNASCTTNCLAPLAKVMNDRFGMKQGLMTTIHSYTNDQNTLDQGHKDLRRARAAAVNQIPTTTGAAKAVGVVIPELNGKLDGFAIRVPTPNVSLVDLVANYERSVTKEEVNAALKEASEKELKGVMSFNTDPLVSSDYNGAPFSSNIDAALTSVLGDKSDLVKVVSWYDNETGYSQRMVDLAYFALTGEYRIYSE